MQGSEGAARYLMKSLMEHMPGKLGEMVERLNEQLADELPEPLSIDKDLPMVQRWHAHDIDELEVSGFPAILITEVESTGRIANVNQETGFQYQEWTFEYLMRVYCWTLGDSAGDTSLRLKRYIQAIEEILLGHKLLFQSEDEQIAVDGASIRHSYSDAAVDDAQQILQAAYVEIRLQTIERISMKLPPYSGRVPIVTSLTQVKPGDPL